jgi:colanic acid biosynthesis protein WcaH
MDNTRLLEVVDATPLVSIDLIVCNTRQEVLLGKRCNRPARGFWFVPGGRIRKNERIAAALARIARVETGWVPPPAEVHFRGVYEHLYDDNFLDIPGIGTHYVVLAYTFTVADGIRLVHDDQHSAFAWWDRSRLLASTAVHANTKAYFA